MRTLNACDGCTLRRVKCRGAQPCIECRKRSLECTFLRPRGKPGPKGPRLATSQKIRDFQRSATLRRQVPELPSPAPPPPPGSAGTDAHHDKEEAVRPNSEEIGSQSPSSGNGGVVVPITTPPASVDPSPGVFGPPRRQSLPVDAAFPYIEVFRQRLGAVWPVIDCDALRRRLSQHNTDYETRALASALCAGSIAQLRLPEHTKATPDGVSSHQFARDAEHFRVLYEYREAFTVPTLLTSFFLHVYNSNSQKLRTGAMFLRECVSFVQAMCLDQSAAYRGLSQAERELRLRIFWMVFITER